jgi:hypothetical protein
MNSSEKLFLESLSHIEYDSISTNIFKILKDPITRTIPLTIKNTNELSMKDIATSKYMPKESTFEAVPSIHRMFGSAYSSTIYVDDWVRQLTILTWEAPIG